MGLIEFMVRGGRRDLRDIIDRTEFPYSRLPSGSQLAQLLIVVVEKTIKMLTVESQSRHPKKLEPPKKRRRPPLISHGHLSASPPPVSPRIPTIPNDRSSALSGRPPGPSLRFAHRSSPIQCSSGPARDFTSAPKATVYIHPAGHSIRWLFIPPPHHIPGTGIQEHQRHNEHRALESQLAEVAQCGGRRSG
jgi:hypothetical protein